MSEEALKVGGVFDDVEGLSEVFSHGGNFSQDYKGVAVVCGEELKAPTTHAAAPAVQFTPSSSNDGKKYTLILTDPDAPSRATHEFREFIHWVVSDITAESLQAGGAVTGTTVVDYLGVGAPCNSGLHRYVFLLFEQPDGATPADLAGAFEGRGGKKAVVSAKAAGLGAVVGANFFESQWDESIDAVHVGMGWLPPAAYRSPSQQAAAAQDALKVGGVFDDVESLSEVFSHGGNFSQDYKGVAVVCGEELKAPTTHAAAPAVQFTPSSSNDGKKYTLILTDPDAPSRATHEFREFIHWVVSDITAESLQAGGAVTGTTVVDYLGVGAPCNSGLHRYVFLLFEQPDGATPADLAGAFEGRGGKKAVVSAKAAGLGAVVGANFFESQWDESIDAVHVGMGWLPPAAYRSPSQQAAAAASAE